MVRLFGLLRGLHDRGSRMVQKPSVSVRGLFLRPELSVVATGW